MAKSNAELKQRALLEMHERYLHDYASIKGHLARAEKELRRQKRENRKQAQEIERLRAALEKKEKRS